MDGWDKLKKWIVRCRLEGTPVTAKYAWTKKCKNLLVSLRSCLFQTSKRALTDKTLRPLVQLADLVGRKSPVRDP